jgi:hypothetical protein
MPGTKLEPFDGPRGGARPAQCCSTVALTCDEESLLSVRVAPDTWADRFWRRLNPALVNEDCSTELWRCVVFSAELGGGCVLGDGAGSDISHGQGEIHTFLLGGTDGEDLFGQY